MRQLLLSPRWIFWHLLTLGGMVICGLFAVWQWQRAGSSMGSALNVGYGLQWPVFAVFFGVMWWRMLRMEASRLQPSSGPEEAGLQKAGREEAAPAVLPAAAPARARSRPVADGRSPFGPRPVSITGPGAAAGPTDAADPELAEYNRMLADLAERRDTGSADRPRTH